MEEDVFDSNKVNEIFLKSDGETDKSINIIQKMLKILSLLMYWKAFGLFQSILYVEKTASLGIEVGYQDIILTAVTGMCYLITGFQLGKIFKSIKMTLDAKEKIFDSEIFGKVIFILKILIILTVLGIIFIGARISEIINYIMIVS